MSYILTGVFALAVLAAAGYLLLSRKQTRDIVIWLKWPPPVWTFVAAAIVAVAAAVIILAR